MNNESQTQQGDDESYGGEIDVMHVVLMLWRYRLVLVVGTVLWGIAAFVMSASATPAYEATAKLIVSPPKTGAPNEATPAVNIASFRALVENQSLAAKIVEEFGLNKAPHSVAPSRFFIHVARVETIRDTNVIVVSARLWDRDLAARIANRLAEAAEQLARQLSQEEVVNARDLIETQLDQSRTRLDQAEQRLETFKRQAQIELLRKDVDALLGQRGALLALLVDIQAEKARLSQAEAQLAKRDRIETLKRSIDTDPAAMEAMRSRGAETGSVLPLQLRNESVNPVYEDLDRVVAESRTKLAGMERQRAELIDVRRLDRDQQAKLSQLYQQEMTLSRLQIEYDIAKAVYVDVSTRYEQARLQVAGRSAQLQLMDRALPPDRPVSRHVIRNSTVAMVIGFVLAAMATLLLSGIRDAARRERATTR